MRAVSAICLKHGIKMVTGFDLDPRAKDGDKLMATQVVLSRDLVHVSPRLRAAALALKPELDITTITFVGVARDG